MKAQSYLKEIKREEVTDVKGNTRTIIIKTHVNKSGPGRRIREKEDD